MTEESTIQSVKSAGIVGELEILVFGVIISLFSYWLFGGFGYWLWPGLVIVFIGLSELITKQAGKADLRVGLLVTFFGLASYLAFVMHVLLGGLQILSVVVLVIGIILLIRGFMAGR
ncbi:MAG: hypothetical protein ACXACG_01870 [Candidatus Thorarchaeota archaeon]|jgi:hypothetical protein